MTGKGPTLQFVERIVKLWPEDFRDELNAYWAAKQGGVPSSGAGSLHIKQITAALSVIERDLVELRKAVAALANEEWEEE
jgi:hypothetical protein